jgi:hypothetical protein
VCRNEHGITDHKDLYGLWDGNGMNEFVFWGRIVAQILSPLFCRLQLPFGLEELCRIFRWTSFVLFMKNLANLYFIPSPKLNPNKICDQLASKSSNYYDLRTFIKGWNPFMGMPCLSVARCLSASCISLTVQYFRNLFSAFIRKGHM